MQKIRWFCWNGWRWVRLGMVGAIAGPAIGLITPWLMQWPVAAQVPPLPLPPLPNIGSLEKVTPQGVQEFLPFAQPDLVSAPVWLDGRPLFLVAAPPAGEDAATDQWTPIEQRVWEIENRLREFAAQDYTADTLEVEWELEPTTNQPIIYVNDQFFFTVTSLDAKVRGLADPTVRAEELTRSIRSGLLRYKRERQPTFLRRQAIIATGILVFTAFLTLVLNRLEKVLARRKARLLVEEPVSLPASSNEEINGAPPSATALRIQAKRRERHNLLGMQQMGLRMGYFLSWGLAVFSVVGLFPYTRWLQPQTLNVAAVPLRVAALVLGIYGLIRVSYVMIDRILVTLQESAALAPDASQRLALRFSTFSVVIKNIAASLLIAIGVLIVLAQLGVQVAPILAGAGLVGVAVSLASQNVIQDIINGFLILLEDQYGVGDVIMVDQVSGFVETMNLRITQLRNEEGRLITIPNGKIGIVQNLSKEWSRVDLQIAVAPSADIDQALGLIEEVADGMSQDPHWQRMILEPPLLLGVDQLDHVGATVRLWIKTLPLKQWEVGREYRRRLKIAFDRVGIPIGVPHQSIQVLGAIAQEDHTSGMGTAPS